MIRLEICKLIEYNGKVNNGCILWKGVFFMANTKKDTQNSIRLIRNSANWICEDKFQNLPKTIEIAKRTGYQVNVTIRDDEKQYIRFTYNRVPNIFVTDAKIVNFLCLADLHIGSPKFCENLLRKVLDRAERIGVKYVFIAGDVFQGIEGAGKLSNKQQAEKAFSIFKEYNLIYYAIDGNHDLSFEMESYQNPLRIVKELMKAAGKKFYYTPAFCVNFILSDIAIRLVHLNSKKYQDKVKLESESYLIGDTEKVEQGARYKKGDYPIKMIIFGDTHKISFLQKNGIFLLEVGSMLFHSRTRDRFRMHVCRYSKKRGQIKFQITEMKD